MKKKQFLLRNVANIKERYNSLFIPLKRCEKKKILEKIVKISSAAHSQIFHFFLEFFFFLLFSHFFKGMNKEKYHFLKCKSDLYFQHSF